MAKIPFPVKIALIVSGFSGAGYLLHEAQSLAPLATQYAAVASADTLRALPDPLPNGSGEQLQALSARTHDLAVETASSVAAIRAPAILEGAPSGDGPNRLQTAGLETSAQLTAIAAPVVALPGQIDPGQIQFAGRSFSNWITSLSGGADPEPVVVASVAAPAPAPDVKVASLPAPIEPVPAAPKANTPAPAPATTVAAAPALDTLAPSLPAPIGATPSAAAPAVSDPLPDPNEAVVAQTAKPADDAAAKDSAGSVADTLNQKFNDLMKSLTGAEEQPAPPADTAAAPQAPAASDAPASVAEAASDLVLSGLSFAAGADESGTITLSGRGIAGRKLKLFLNDEPIGATTVAQNGRWLFDVTHPLPLGDHQARADLLGADGKVTHSAIYMFARQAATVAGGETTIVPLAKMATAPAEAAKPVDVAAAAPAAPEAAKSDVIKIVPPDEMAKQPAATPEVASVPEAKPVVAAKRRIVQAQAKPVVRRQIARKPQSHPHTVVVNIRRGSNVERVRVPDGLLRTSVGHLLQPRRARHAHPHARKATARRCHRATARHAVHKHRERDDDRW